MTLIHGITEDGAELPVLVDQQGRLVAAPVSELWGLPPGGIPGQIVAKSGEGDGEAEWIDDGGSAPALYSIGLKRADSLVVPSGAAPTPLMFGGGALFRNGAAYNTGNGRVTPEVGGFWLFIMSAQLPDGGQGAEVRLRFNGAEVARGGMPASDGSTPPVLHAYTVQLCNGQTSYFTAEAVHAGGGPLQLAQIQGYGVCLSPS